MLKIITASFVGSLASLAFLSYVIANQFEHLAMQSQEDLAIKSNYYINPIPKSVFITVDHSDNSFDIFDIAEQTFEVFEAESNLMYHNGAKEITINFHSPGGSVFYAYIIREQIGILKERGVKIVTKVNTKDACMSACPILFLTGDERIAFADSVFMFHAPYIQYPYNTSEPLIRFLEKSVTTDRREFADSLAKQCPNYQRIKVTVLDHKDHYFKADILDSLCGSGSFFTQVIPALTVEDGLKIIVD